MNIRRILFSLSALLVSIMMPAADLPSLPVASRIKTGMLDNGIAYYLVTNNTEKGRADIALVQKGGYDNETPYTAGSTAVHAMGSLTMLPHFRTNTPFHYLSRNCIWPGAEGYVASYPDATVYRFRNLEFSRSKDIVDSTLLMVFDIIGMQSEYLGGRYAPQNQAIIISGDVDAGAVLNKMNMLSMLVTRGRPSTLESEYSWSGSSEASYRHVQPTAKGLASVSAEYVYPRTPEKNMNTVQPLVSQKFASELGIILRKRLAKSLRNAGVPVSDIKYSYTSSKEGPGNELFRISIVTSEEYLKKATAILSETLANLDTYGSGAAEYRDTQNELIMNMKRDFSGDVVNNTVYIDQCISAYLYGASLASAATSMDFFLTKNLQDDLGVKLFNNFVFALLDKSKNLTVECMSDTLSKVNVPECFAASWSAKAAEPYTVSYSDTLKLKKSGTKLKIKTVAQEPLSGGQIWTFDNGLRVIYKNVPKTGMFHYMWLLKGGYSLVPGLKSGEGAYVSDMLSLYDVPGMSCYNFSNMLSANGISMSREVTVSDLRISGAAPSSRLHLLLRSLCSLAENRTMNRAAYDYYRECNKVKALEKTSMEAVLDSLMFPGNDCSSYKRPIDLPDDFQKRAEKFYASEFSKMNDGVLIIVGDFDEYTLKKDLCRDLSGFSTEKASSFRTRSQFRVGPGNAYRLVAGDKQEVEIGISAPLMYTAANFMSSYIAAMAMQDKLASTLADCGWYGKASWDFVMFPEERFNFRMHCAMSDRTGVPASLVQVDSVEEVVSKLRRAVGSVSVTPSDLSVYRSVLLKSVEARLADPQMIISMLVLRYSYGKDLVTKYKDKINEVTVDRVNQILSQMAEGRTAEYAVRTKSVGDRFFIEQGTPVFDGEIPVPLSVADSLGIAREGYRAIGLDTTAYSPVWLDSARFRSFMSELPKPVPMPIIPKKDTLKTVTPADSLKVGSDSTSVAADSLKVAADSTRIAVDSVKVTVDSTKSGSGTVYVTSYSIQLKDTLNRAK